MKTKTLFLLVVVVVLCYGKTLAQDKFSSSVLLEVQYKNDEMVKNEMSSYLAREIRSLKDVETVPVSSPGTYTVSVMMVDATVGDRKLGYAVSVTITRQMNCTTMFKKKDGTPQINTYDDIENTYIYVIPTDELKDLAQRIIAQFDAGTLETWRQVFRMTRPKP